MTSTIFFRQLILINIFSSADLADTSASNVNGPPAKKFCSQWSQTECTFPSVLPPEVRDRFLEQKSLPEMTKPDLNGVVWLLKHFCILSKPASLGRALHGRNCVPFL
jgi:hypothetical protein